MNEKKYFHWFLYKDRDLNPSQDAWEERINKIIRKIKMFNDEVKNHQNEIDTKIENVKVELQTEIRALHNAVNLLLESKKLDGNCKDNNVSVENSKEMSNSLLPNLLPSRLSLNPLNMNPISKITLSKKDSS